MDKDRQIRFLIPPFFVVASLIWCAYLKGVFDSNAGIGENGINALSIKIVVSIIGVIGVTAIPAGYAIGIVTIAVLRSPPVCLLFRNKKHLYDLAISDAAMKEIWKVLAVTRKEEEDLAAMAIFDQACLRVGVHEWLLRRWTSFNISAQCVTALLVSIPLAYALRLPGPAGSLEMWKWLAPIIVLVAVFVWHSVRAWSETRMMYDVAVKSARAFRPEPLARPQGGRRGAEK